MYFCYGKNGYCDLATSDLCNNCEHLDGTGGKYCEVENMTLPEQIKAILTAKHMTQSELSRLTGITERTICNILKGHNEGNIITYKLMAEALNCDIVLVPRSEVLPDEKLKRTM